MGLFCAVKGCHNSGDVLKKLKRGWCFQCRCYRLKSSCRCPPPFKLIPFPTRIHDKAARQKWEMLVNRVDQSGHLWSPSKDSRVCSVHFVDGQPSVPNPYPALHLGCDGAEGRIRGILFGDETTCTPVKRRKTGGWTMYKEVPDPPIETLPPYMPKLGVHYCNKAAHLQKRVNVLSSLLSQERQKVARLTTQVENLRGVDRKRDVSKSLLKSDQDVSFFTGIRSKAVFQRLLSFITPYVTRRWRGTVTVLKSIRRYCEKRSPNRILLTSDELLLTLMKLRLGLLNKDLAARFQISTALCSQIFFSWLRGLSLVLSSIVFMPEMDQIKASKPARYNHLPDLHSIIDCTEMFIETPKDLYLQSMSWSEYKHHNTVKVLIAVAPNGTIIFTSEAYTGRISDKALTLESSYLDQVPPYTMIMADKGFNIQEECADRCLSLHVPPGRRGQSQMTSACVRKTKRIGNLRILVEQVIRELKTFRILQFEMPLSLVPRVKDIVTVCSALVNWKKPIYSE